MDHATLLDIARDWSFWDAPPPGSVPRTLSLPVELRPDLALVVQGVRRGGKSTLLQQLIGRYGLDRERCLFLNFEDPRLATSLDHRLLDTMVSAFEADRGKGATYFLDEIQWVSGWQKWLRIQLDRPKDRRFVVTGSNAHLLSGEIGSTLTGRHHSVELFPFDLDEFRSAKPRATLAEFLESGGFPAVVRSPDRDTILRGYFNDIVERDIRERVAARSALPLRKLVQMLLESAGSETSTRRLSAALGLAPDTAGLYIDAAESAYFALGTTYFAHSARRQLARNRKFYPIDTGLRRAVVTATGADRGKQFECAAYLLLRRHFRTVHYWRDDGAGGGEVDFVVERNGKAVPIQVSWESPTERHHRAVDAFHEAHPHSAEAVFITRQSFKRGVPELTA
ncbi:MAG: ATP-binding protein [Phycisphaeraceae bacterium]|nr:ATP-binding protein [Phycisphaeraceae bacterium]